MEKHDVLWGVDWYPEQWDRSKWVSDVDRMAKQGFAAARIMEFAWAVIESEKGRFDFSLFDEAVDLLESRGLKVVIGTPTATFPAWLLDEDPAVLAVHPSRMERDFGTRRMGCFNASSYRAAAHRVVRAAAERYGGRKAVIGWQVDNEIGHEGSDHCVCDRCLTAWHAWLAVRYGAIEKLNEAWGTVFWGTTYARFKQVPLPRVQVASGHNPALLLDYDRFCSASAVSWARSQVEILRSIVPETQWITTNLYPAPLGQCIDMEDMLEPMDAAGWDNYPVWGAQERPYPYFFTSYMLSYVRGLKARGTFKIMEQFTGIQGHTHLGYAPSPAQTALWTNQAVARGADSVFYFRWRTAAAGQEQLCYGLRDTDDRETDRERALVRNMAENAEAFSRFAAVPPEAAACLVYDRDSSRLLREQPLSTGLELRPVPYLQVGYDAEMARYFAPFVLFNVNADVKSVRSVELDLYKLISLPLYELADPAFVDRLAAWVRAGGTLVVGWRAGARRLDNRNVDEPLPGLFAELAGVRVRSFESLGKGSVGLALTAEALPPLVPGAILPTKGEVWAEILEPTTARVAARYRSRKKRYAGEPAMTVNAYGAGRVWYLGTSPDAATTFLLYRRLLKRAGLAPRFLGFGVEAVRRRTEDGGEVEVILNHGDRPRRVAGSRLGPYGTRIRPVPVRR